MTTSTKPQPPTRIPTQKAAARALGINVRSLREWEAAAWFPSGGRTADGHDVAAIQAARQAAGFAKVEAREQELSGARRDSGVMRAVNARLSRVRSEWIELKRGRQSCELLDRFEVQQFWAELLTNLRGQCQQMPSLVARACCRKCQPAFLAAMPPALAARQHAFVDAMTKAMKGWDELNCHDEPLPPLPEMPADVLVIERVRLALSKIGFEEARLAEKSADLFPRAALAIQTDTLVGCLRSWVVEIPPLAVAKVALCCRADVRRDVVEALQTMAERTAGELDHYERRLGVVRAAIAAAEGEAVAR